MSLLSAILTAGIDLHHIQERVVAAAYDCTVSQLARSTFIRSITLMQQTRDR